MVSGKAIAVAGMFALVAGGAVIARADDPAARSAQAGGGLAVSPVRVDRTAAVGAVDNLTVANNTKAALAVTVKARPWIQSSTGTVSPNRRGTLGAVGISEDAFTLAPGASRQVTVTLRSAPSGGYLYGALEVVGVPTDLAKRKGVVAGYRLLGPLRYNAATPVSSFTAGAAKVVGTGSKRTLTLSVRNTGNTIEPVSGSVRLKGALGTKNSSVPATRILPGKSIRLGLVSGSALRPGSYTATVRLKQAKKTTTLTKRITVRR